MSEGKKFTFYFSFVAAACFLLPSAGMALDYPPSDVEICSCTAINAIYYNASGSSSCKIIKNIEPLIDVYKNRTKQFCVVTTKECDDGRFYWNGIEYYHGRFASKETCDNGAAVFKYHLEPGEATQAENGSSAEFVFLDAQNRRTSSNISVIRIIGPPTPPTDIMVDVGCQKVNISWTPSPRADQCYVVTIQCGETFVARNVTVYTNSYELNFHPSLRKQCMVSVYAANPAGSSPTKNITKQISKDPDYEVPDIGVKITNENSAILYFSITVKKDCPFSHPQYYNSCVGGRCVTDDQGPISSSWSYNEITQLQLSLYERFRVTIAVCTLTKCTNWSQSISTYHVQSIDVTCGGTNGSLLRCNFAKGHQIKGCVFVFTEQVTNKELPPVFVDDAKNASCSLKPGVYNVTVYDWKGNDRWKDLDPAVTQQITVEKNTIEDDAGKYIGLSIGVVLAALLILFICVLLIVVLSLYYKKPNRQGRYRPSQGAANGDPENPPNNQEPVRRDSYELDIRGGTTGSTDDSDKTFEATTVTNRVEQPTATTDLSKDPESSTPPPSVPEPTIEEGMTDTSICGSDKPLLNKRDPTPKRQKESGGSKLPAEMTYPESQPSRYTNMSQQETGKSIKTGDPTVTDEGKDKSAAYVFGKHVKDKENENEFSLVTSSEAQLSDVNSQVVS